MGRVRVIELRPDWYVYVPNERFNLDSPGVYEWRIDGIGLYVGKAKILRKRIRDYPNNVKRLLSGLHWHGNSKREYRAIHKALSRAHDEKRFVQLSVLENCAADDRAARELYWIEKRRLEQSDGGPAVLNSESSARRKS